MVSACSDLIAFDGFSSNFVYTCKLRVSGMGLLMSKFCQFYMKMAGIIVSLSFFFFFFFFFFPCSLLMLLLHILTIWGSHLATG